MIGDQVLQDEDTIFHLHYDNQQSLPMWVVYRPTTADYPGSWVARLVFTLPAASTRSVVILASTLDDLRACLPPDLHCLERYEEDDQNIEEVWM